MKLTTASLALLVTTFNAVCLMAATSDGTGYGFASDVVKTEADKGNLTDLKTKGLVETSHDEGILWISLTDEGRALAKRLLAKHDKIRFVVLDENMLGYIDPRSPLTVSILSVSFTRGTSSPRAFALGTLPLSVLPMQGKPSERWPAGEPIASQTDFRPATLEDFEKNFRIVFTGYQNDTSRYDFPTA